MDAPNSTKDVCLCEPRLEPRRFGREGKRNDPESLTYLRQRRIFTRVYANGVLSTVEAAAFTRHLSGYLNDDGYKELQTRLGANPELGDLMPATGGFRKLRWTDTRRGKDRRGGLRIIYYYFQSDHEIWLMTVYDKDEA